MRSMLLLLLTTGLAAAATGHAEPVPDPKGEASQVLPLNSAAEGARHAYYRRRAEGSSRPTQPLPPASPDTHATDVHATDTHATGAASAGQK